MGQDSQTSGLSDFGSLRVFNTRYFILWYKNPKHAVQDSLGLWDSLTQEILYYEESEDD